MAFIPRLMFTGEDLESLVYLRKAKKSLQNVDKLYFKMYVKNMKSLLWHITEPHGDVHPITSQIPGGNLAPSDPPP